MTNDKLLQLCVAQLAPDLSFVIPNAESAVRIGYCTCEWQIGLMNG
jgi:hypothetical protein